MKSKLVMVLTLLAVVFTLTPAASAHLLEATTSVALNAIEREGQLEESIRTAVGEVLDSGIAFTPTLVTVTDARVIGERLYVRVLIADAQGEEALAGLEEDLFGEEHRERLDPSSPLIRPFNGEEARWL